MNWPLIVAVLFLVGAFYNFFGPEPDPTEGVAGVAIAGALGGIHLYQRKQDSLNVQFHTWLIENAHAVESGGAVYNGLIVNPQTVVTQYQATFSFLIVSIKSRSRFYFVGDEPTLAAAAIFTTISLIFGWWGIPWGPVYTIQTVASNLRGGEKLCIGDILAIIQGAGP